MKPTIIPRAEHSISRAHISESALKVLYRLREGGFEACLVGGAVRDLLLGRRPKDFDVATDARPEQVRALFGNCRLIGRRFRLALVRFGREVVEVATFRASHEDSHEWHGRQTDDGRIVRDNVYGDMDADARRRDLSANALYYNIKDFSVIDYFGGVADIAARRIRVIGDAATRYREDPVRMLRVLRFAAKLGFALPAEATRPISGLAGLLDEIPPARLFDEALKLFHKGHALGSFDALREYGLFGYLFLQTEEALAADGEGLTERFIRAGLANTDKRVNEGQTVNPAYLYAFLLWGVLRGAMREAGDAAMKNPALMHALSEDIFQAQAEQTALPRRYSARSREIWAMQPRFEQRRGKRPLRFVEQPGFRAAYDFLLLRNQTGEDLSELCDWWTAFQQTEEATQAVAQAARPQSAFAPRRRPRPRRRGKRQRGGFKTELAADFNADLQPGV